MTSRQTTQLIGRCVAITGGARGIGRATAEAFVAAGAHVAIGDIDYDLVQRAAAEVAEKTDGTIVGLALDVTDSNTFAAFLDAAQRELGGLDVLVNNAGIMPNGPFLDESDAVSDRQIDINFRAVVIGSKLAGTRFTHTGGGHIVNVASLAGLVAAPGVAVYCASKSAVIGLGAALHQELAPHGVVVTTIAPSLVRTELISGLPTNKLIDTIATVEPHTVARAIVGEVASAKGGLRIVPRVTGGVMKTTLALPENVRNKIYKLMGVQTVNLHADDTARQEYRDRTEPGRNQASRVDLPE